MSRSISASFRAALALAALLVLAAPAPASAQDDEGTSFPERLRPALQLYEEEVAPEEWADGPVEYIMLDHERDVWNDLETDAERRAFIDWFWDRRDVDPRDDEHAFKQEFYERVASANRRFKGFPRGWRSDRGRVWVTLGPPNGGMRPTRLDNFGRCRAREGEWWTYYTQGTAFQSSMGEFNVIFVETRVGRYEICDPTMMGTGAMPTDLRRALEITAEAAVVDTVTEFEGVDAGRRTGDRTMVRDVESSVEELDVPTDEWGLSGAGGAVVVPIRLPLREILFESVGDRLLASLEVEAGLVAMGEAEGQSGIHTWTVELEEQQASEIGSAVLKTALVLPAEPGGYSVRVRVTDPLSATNWVWEGASEVTAEGTAVSLPLVGDSVIRLRDGGEVAVLATDPPRLTAGDPFAAVVWVRGVDPDETVTLSLVGTSNEAASVQVTGAAWGAEAAAGPLIIEAMVPDVEPGGYVIRFDMGPELGVVERVVQVSESERRP